MSEQGKSKDNRPRHAPPKGHSTRNQELLYDPNVATSTHAEQARTLAEKMSTATLCTMSIEPEGFPYGSFVTYVIHEGHPIFLISVLAEHTKNLQKSSKASLLIAEGGDGNPLALGRVTLVGECTKMPEEERESAKESFLAKHESASFYVDFGDFSFYRLKVEAIRYIGGFGRMSWVGEENWLQSKPDPLVPYAMDIIEHMNDDHSDANLLYVRALADLPDATDANMVGVDCYGVTLKADTPAGPRMARVPFVEPLTSDEQARPEIIKLLETAREKFDNKK